MLIPPFSSTLQYTVGEPPVAPSAYTAFFDDLVATGPFASSLYSTSRLLERSRSRTRERRQALRSQSQSRNYFRSVMDERSPLFLYRFPFSSVSIHFTHFPIPGSRHNIRPLFVPGTIQPRLHPWSVVPQLLAVPLSLSWIIPVPNNTKWPEANRCNGRPFTKAIWP
jgi:hypothetical protein